MSSRELERAEVLGRVGSGDLKLVDAAVLLRLSYRQGKRLWQRYREGGAVALRHGNAGRASHRSKSPQFRRRALALMKRKYGGGENERFGPTLAAEHLAEEDGMVVDHETLRRWMLEAGLWSRQRKRKGHRQRRERKEHFGEFVQLDGSFHAWLEERGPGGCMMNMVDDATSTTLERLGEQETIWAAARVLRCWMETYGVPLALYVDWKNVYKRVATARELLRGDEPETQFGRMCAKLGIQMIGASSPQAKGRVERSHGTHQDRLVKKLRRRPAIRTHAAVNEYLAQEYLPEHNERFAVAPARAEDYHRACPRKAELDKIFRLESERVLGQDWVVRYHGRILQVQLQSRHYAPARGKVTVYEAEDGGVEIEYRGQRLPWREIVSVPKCARAAAAASAPMAMVGMPRARFQPAATHPWRKWRGGGAAVVVGGSGATP